MAVIHNLADAMQKGRTDDRGMITLVSLLQAAWDSIVVADPRIDTIYSSTVTIDREALWAKAPTGTLLFAALSRREPKELRSTVEDLVKLRGLNVLVALEDDLAVGVLAGCIEAVPWSQYSYGSLHLMYVVPSVRRTGVGRSLAASFAREATRRGCAEVWLDVMTENHGALACWQQMGFESVWHSMRISAKQLAVTSGRWSAKGPDVS